MRRKLFIGAIVFALLLVACQGGEPGQLQLQQATPVVTQIEDLSLTYLTDDQGETVSPPAGEEQAELVEMPEVDPFAVRGNIVTAGSSTVFPLAEAVASQFEDEGYRGRITIDSIGSGAGFERFCVSGEIDIANASRAINESEIASCHNIGREPIEFRVGTDALVVAVNQNNDFLEEISLEELAVIFSTAERWSDVRASWPDEEILRYIPGTDSGTFDYFVEAVFDEDEKPILSASNLEMSENDNVLIQGILGSPYAVGFFGYAYYEENQGRLQVLALEGVEPSVATVDSAEYPLARPLFIYSTAEIMQQKAQVAAYINFFLTNVNEVVFDVGYFPASDAVLNEGRQKWLEAMEE